MLLLTDKQERLKQLDSLEEHLRGIGKMIEEEASCFDVVHQTYAVRKAIEQLEDLLVEQHVSGCVDPCLASTDEKALFTAFVQVCHPGGDTEGRR